MKQFEVFHNPSESSRGFAPYVVVVQTHHIVLDTVLVAPLVSDKNPTSVEIAVNVEGRDLVVALTEMGSVRTTSLTRVISNLAAHEDEIRRGLDRLFTGF